VVFATNWLNLLDSVTGVWGDRLRHRRRLEGKNLVLRTQVVSRETYIDHLCKEPDHAGHRAELGPETRSLLERRLPTSFWMTEFTLPELYSVNKTKLGEVLLKFSPSARDRAALQDTTTPNSALPRLCVGFRFINHMELRDDAPITLGFKAHTKLYRRLKATHEY